jgi:hypothetical protein
MPIPSFVIVIASRGPPLSDLTFPEIHSRFHRDRPPAAVPDKTGPILEAALPGSPHIGQGGRRSSCPSAAATSRLRVDVREVGT